MLFPVCKHEGKIVICSALIDSTMPFRYASIESFSG